MYIRSKLAPNVNANIDSVAVVATDAKCCSEY